MAANADSVVVELIAKTEQFDKPVQQSAAQYDANMNKIVASSTKAEAAVTASSSARSAALKRESAQISQFTRTLAADMVGASDIISGPRSPFTVPVREAAHVSHAFRTVALAAGAMGGIFAEVAVEAAIALAEGLKRLILHGDKASETISALVEKLKEHARQTHLSEEADRVWSQTLDGLIDRHKRLNEELGKRLTTQAQTDQANLALQQADLDRDQQDLAKERRHLAELQQRLTAARESPGVVSSVAGAVVHGSNPEARSIEKEIAQSQEQIKKLEGDLATLQQSITRSQVVLGQRQGEAIADLTAKAQQVAEAYHGVLATIIQGNPTLGVWADDLYGAADGLIKAANEAAGAGVEFAGITNQVSGLDKRLNLGQETVKTYTAAVAKLTKQLMDMTAAAKEAAKQQPADPVKSFKQAVIGAEGTGANRAGSPAAGFGQFMPATFETYFKRLYSEQAKGLSDQQIDDLRNKRQIAEAVIDAATDDYVRVLKSAGQKVTEASLYTVHVLGAPDAKKFFAASPDQSVKSALGGGRHADAVVAQNGTLFTGTVAQARTQLAKRIGDSSAAVSQGAAALQQTLDRGAKDLQDQIQEEKERAARYIAEKSGFEEQVIEARKGLATTAEEMWAFETAANIAAKQHTDDQIAAQEEARKLLPQEAEELKRINGERAKYRQQLVDQRLAQAQSAREAARNDNAVNVELGLLSAQEENLHSVEQLAKTSTQKRQIEDRLIDLQFAELRIRLEAQIAEAARLKALAETTKNEQDIAAATKAEADAAIAKAKLQGLPQQQAEAHQANADQNAAPLQSYFNSIPDTAAEINDAFENIAVHGLQTFNDALTNAIVNYRSLGDVGRAVLQGLEADLIKLALQLIEQHTIGAALGSASTAAATAQAAVLGAAWAGPAALASLASYGANAIPAQAALISTGAIATLIGAPKATGGRIFGPGSDTSDNILTPLSPDEYVIKASSARSIGYDALDHLNAHGSLSGGFANGGRIQPSNARAASPGRALSPSDIQDFRSIVSEAVRAGLEAMPDVNLYPVVDSEEVFTRGIKTTGGSKAMVAHVAANSTKYKATLNRPGS